MAKRYSEQESAKHITTETLAIYTCPDCQFRFDAAHSMDDKEGGYICPDCESDE